MTPKTVGQLFGWAGDKWWGVFIVTRKRAEGLKIGPCLSQIGVFSNEFYDVYFLFQFVYDAHVWEKVADEIMNVLYRKMSEMQWVWMNKKIPSLIAEFGEIQHPVCTE